ncbi:hypothetical protein D3C80_1412580 [compost metagenome]
MLQLALDPGDGEVVVLDPDRGFALDAEVGVELGPQAAGDRAQVAVGMVQLGIAERAVVGRAARLHDLGRGRQGEYRKGGGGENNVTHELKSLLMTMNRSLPAHPAEKESLARSVVPSA